MAAIDRRKYGELSGGEAVEEITLTNDDGWRCKVLTLGGIISELHVPDRDGNLADVVLGYDNLEDIMNPDGWPYFGCIVGRVAGRVTGGRFILGKEEVVLNQNDGDNHLHGGVNGFDRRIWGSKTYAGKDGPSVELSYTSPDGEEGYPGEVKICVTYTLTHSGELRLEYKGEADRETPLCLTNHSYFNLSGEETIHRHRLTIPTSKKICCDEVFTLNDLIEDIGGKAEDFQGGKALGGVLEDSHHDHFGLYYIGPKASDPRLVAVLEDPKSGRVLEALSTESSLQLYCACYLETEKSGKKGRSYQPHSAVCLETQGYSNGVNVPDVENIMITPDCPYRQLTIFRFSHRA